jgi:hypothetical protein
VPDIILIVATASGGAGVPFTFGDHALDPERRELRRGAALVELGPQILDILIYLIGIAIGWSARTT